MNTTTLNQKIQQYANALPEVVRIAKMNHTVVNMKEAIDVIDDVIGRSVLKNKYDVEYDIMRALIYKDVFNEDLTSLYFN